MLVLDGSMYEGGGAIIRVAVGLSAVCNKPIKIINIRAKRCNPGLRPQHLNAVLAVGELCNAETNAKIGCREMKFFPKKLEFKNLDVNIGTAGSIPLVLYSLLIPSVFTKEKFKIKIIGGTDTKMAPPINYTKYVLIENLKKFGLKADLEIKRRGYYPKGGGKVEITFYPSQIKKINLINSGKLAEIKGKSHASEFLKKANVSERQAKSARKLLLNYDVPVNIKSTYENTSCPGSGIDLFAITENSVLGGNALGAPGKPSEKVGKQAAEMLIKEINSNSPADYHLADQLIPFLALFGGEIKTSKISLHTKTNIWVCEQFFGRIFEIEGDIIKAKKKNNLNT